MDIASFLKRTANLLVGISILKQVGEDLVRRSPYPAAGTAAVLGLVAGMQLGRQRRRRITT